MGQGEGGVIEHPKGRGLGGPESVELGQKMLTLTKWRRGALIFLLLEPWISH